ncbi:MAG: hypothetical protein ACF8GE_11850 [Phycisphaerales bacterium JB043]
MSGSVCYLDPSLDSFVVIHDGDVSRWDRPDVAEEAASSIEARADQCADALLERLDKLTCVVLGVDTAGFRWISSPSDEERVVSIAARRAMSEEGAVPITASIQPMDATAARRSTLMSRLSRTKEPEAKSRGVSHATVLALEDGPARLWFDALDRRGVMARDVLTTWHAMARVWGTEDRCTLVVCEVSPARLVWALCEGGSLLVGGHGHLGEIHATVSRCTMDWLTWCAELGVEIETMRLVMASTSEFAGQCASRWSKVTIEQIKDDAPLERLLREISECDTPDEQMLTNPRRTLTSITHRSNRAHRRLIRVASLALVVLGIGVGIFGYRLHAIGQTHRREARNLENQNWQILKRAMSLDDRTLADYRGRNLVPKQVLEGEVILAQNETSPIDAPPPPLPIFEENRILLELLSQMEGLEITGINIDDNQSVVTFKTESYAPGEDLHAALVSTETRIIWEEGNPRGQPPALFWDFKGEWEAEE